MNKILDFKSFSKQDLSILFVGDIMCNDKQSSTIDMGKDPFIHLSKFFKQFDLAVGNLETTFSGEVSGFPRFSADDRFASVLKKYFKIVFTANNHCHDFGEKGILRTIKILDNNDILHIGTKLTNNKRNMLNITINGYDISFLNYTIDVNGEEREDTEDTGIFFHKLNPEEDKKGLISFYTEAKVKEEINLAKERSEIVIIGVHGGPEYSRTPKEGQRERILGLIKSGADIVIGGHPHVFEGGFQRDNGFGVYSLGNFFSEQHELDGSDSGTIMCTRIDKFGNNTYSFLPICTYVHKTEGHKVLPLALIEQGYYNFINSDERKILLESLDKIRKTFREQGLTEEPFYMHLAI